MDKYIKLPIILMVLITAITGGYCFGKYSKSADEIAKSDAQKAVDEFIYQLNKKLLEDIQDTK
jgi:hypothetical protein